MNNVAIKRKKEDGRTGDPWDHSNHLSHCGHTGDTQTKRLNALNPLSHPPFPFVSPVITAHVISFHVNVAWTLTIATSIIECFRSEAVIMRLLLEVHRCRFSLLLGSLGAISRVKEFTTAPPEGVNVNAAPRRNAFREVFLKYTYLHVAHCRRDALRDLRPEISHCLSLDINVQIKHQDLKSVVM